MLYKVLQCRPNVLCNSQRLHLQQLFCDGVHYNSFSFCRIVASKKRLLSISARNYGDKPVILSAVDVVKDNSLFPSVPSTDLSTGSVVDPPFAELGLAQSWWPSSLVEGLFESFFNYTGCPWWLTLSCATLVLRLALLPFFIASRKTTIRMSNHGKELMALRTKMMDSYSSKSIYERQIASRNLKMYTKKHDLGMIKMMLVTGCQPLAFISCLRAIKAMANVPVPSLAASSFFWISSLTDPDPYRLLPFISGCLIGLNLFTALKFSLMPVPKLMTKYAPVIALIPAVTMPLLFGSWSGAFGIYLMTNSFFTLLVTLMLSNKKVHEFVKMPAPIDRTKDAGNSSLARSMFKEALKTSSMNAHRKMEAREIRKMLKAEKKFRKKELKSPPEQFFEIGTEATVKQRKTLDFEKDWRPPKPDIYST